MTRLVFAFAIAALCSLGSAHGAVVLSSNFDSNTGSLSTGLAGPGSTALTVTYTGLEALTASGLTAVAPGTNGFVHSTTQPNVNQNVVSISGNLNAGGLAADPRGFTLTFTPSTTYNLGLVDVIAGHFNGNGGLQGFLSDINFSLSDPSGILFTATDIVDNGEDPAAPVDAYDGFFANGLVPPAIAYTFDATGTTLNAGTTYTIAINQNNLQGGGAFAYFNGFTVNGEAVVAIPEPSTYAILGLAGAAIAWRRRRRVK